MGNFVAPAQAIRRGIARQPLPYGLFSVVDFREDGERWENGIVWETTACEPVDAFEQWFCPALLNEVQSITLGGEGRTSFTLTFDGQTTSAIDGEPDAEAVQEALEALSTIGEGNVSVTQPDPEGPFLVEFIGDLAGVDQPEMTGTPTGGTATVEIETVQDGGELEEILGLPKSLDKLDAPYGEAKPFTVYGHYNCSAMGRNDSLAYGQAQADLHLTTHEEARVEQALWTGDLNNLPNFAGANGYPAPSGVGTFGVEDIDLALAAVEQALAEEYGSLGVIHMSRELALLAIGKMSIDSRGGRLYTKLGTPVVAGTGYTSDKVIGTSPLIAYRSEIFHPSNRPYDLLNRANNDLIAVSERTYVVGIEPCGLVAATITVEA